MQRVNADTWQAATKANINLKLTGSDAYLHMRENYNHVNHCSTVLSRLTALKPQITTEILVHGIQIT